MSEAELCPKCIVFCLQEPLDPFLCNLVPGLLGNVQVREDYPHDEDLGRLTDNPRITVWKGYAEIGNLLLLRKGHSLAFSKESHIIRSIAEFLLLGEQDLGVYLISLTE